MSESIKPKCCGQVSRAGPWGSYQCGKNASMEHEGKHYCKTHHPPTVKAKLDASRAKWRAEQDAQRAREQAASEAAAEQKRRSDAYDQLVDRVKELERALGEYMSAFGQALEAHGIRFAQQQLAADSMARAALAKVLPNADAKEAGK